MGVDLSKLSKAELEAIVSGGGKAAPKKSVKDMSYEELAAIVSAKTPMSGLEAFGRGVMHGGTFGREDDIADLIQEKNLSDLVTGDTPGKRLNKKQEQASQENPYYLNTIGEVVGGVASPLIATLGITAAAGAAPEIAAVTALAAAANKLKYVPKVVQAARSARAANAARAAAIKAGAPVTSAIEAVPFAGRAAEFGGRMAKAAGVGAGFSALTASGEAEKGQQLEEAVKAIPAGAVFGAGLRGAGELLIGGTRLGQRIIAPFTKDQTTRAKEQFQKLFPKGVEAETSPIPGMPTLPKGDEAKGVLQNIAPESYAARIAEQEAALKNAPRPSGEISAPTVSGVNAFEANIEATKIANESAKAASKKDLAASSEEVLVKKAQIKAQIDAAKDKAEEEAKAAFKLETGKAATGAAASNSINKTVASTGLKAELERVKNIEYADQAGAWKAAAPETVLFRDGKIGKRGTFSQNVLNGLSDTEISILNNPSIINDIIKIGKAVDSKGRPKPVTLEQIQQIGSDLAALGRGTTEANVARVAKKLRIQILNASKGRITTPEYKQWMSNIEGTKNFYKKWLPQEVPTVRAAFTTGTAAALPSKSIPQFTGSKESIDKLDQFANSKSADRGVVVENLRQWLGHDLSEKMGEGLGAKSTIPKWINSNSYIFEKFPELRADFGNLGSANKSVFKVISETSAKARAKEINAAQDAILPRNVAEPNLVNMPEKNRFLPSNPTDPKQIYEKMNEVLRDRDPNAMNTFMDAVGKSDDSVSGAKRIITDMITDPKARGADHPTAHDFIDKNREKLNNLFISKEEQELLDMFSAGSKAISAAKNVKGAVVEEGAAKPLVGALLMTLLKTRIGYYPARMAIGAINMFQGIPNEAKRKLIEDALLDPNGATAKLLKTEVTPANFPKIQKWLDASIPGSVQIPEDKPTPRYASGGPVYTHPAISSIRAKRAMRSFAR